MSDNYKPAREPVAEPVVNKDEFAIVTVDDEIRADGLCQSLLKRFYDSLLEGGMDPQEATRVASGADYYVRDFLVGYKHCNLFDERPGIVRQFAGNWYIVNTIEPSIEELAGHLLGVRSFYRFLNGRGLIGGDFLAAMEQECGDGAFYESRIRSFWEITGDGYIAWERECSLKQK
ncbi:hypothetical protein KI811_13585 [Geobacter hydrogenophilus]|uniref:Uncharacterized protein n=1 Tax=Geobacter hydrogenophilus TaxID=40983 RepID=A0A9W6FXE0_9BACT|nr:hypothetical protein [Geobacter hydrogenophilus]MBT0894841.1 hypothetical protein [Geobacter hydrogenophilus]GLI36754.1 hypothetical protein GHYDROH2_02550 [Geobacter hydrogenophilus]